jgi:integrase
MAKRRAHGAGAVRQLPSGRWQARVRDPDDGKTMIPAPKTFATALDAATWLASSDGAPEAAKPDRTLNDFADDWLATRELKPRTRADYRLLLDQHILPALGGYRLKRITVDKVHDWYDALSPKTPTTKARAYGLLRTIMGSAWQRDLIESNPCRVRGGGVAKRKSKTKVATVAELEAIADAIRPERYRAMVLLAGWCALRYGEVTELRRSDVDLETGVLHVRRGVVRVGSTFVVGDPKSDAGIRDVNIPPHILPAIAEHLATVAPDPGALLFPAAGDPAKHLAPSTWCKVYYPARLAAGRPDLRFHDLRHTGLTLAAATGATLADLMARAGHSTASAAMGYQHSVADRDQAIAEALSGFAAGKVIPLKARRASTSKHGART